ncbi:hypothetical protein HAX54_032412 [Datura stramonium]|uniref:Uncharacterized protein n=1 Tax=Datura stramonium TaxID=4076 RepID=A0ABS8SCM8_DATST|nr:hypothetical protein [Datura stramonium]
MVDGSSNVDVEKLISFSNDLVLFLKDDKDVSFLKQCCIEQSNALQSQCHSEYQGLQSSIQGRLTDCPKRKPIGQEVTIEAAAHQFNLSDITVSLPVPDWTFPTYNVLSCWVQFFPHSASAL